MRVDLERVGDCVEMFRMLLIGHARVGKREQLAPKDVRRLARPSLVGGASSALPRFVVSLSGTPLLAQCSVLNY